MQSLSSACWWHTAKASKGRGIKFISFKAFAGVASKLRNTQGKKIVSLLYNCFHQLKFLIKFSSVSNGFLTSFAFIVLHSSPLDIHFKFSPAPGC